MSRIVVSELLSLDGGMETPQARPFPFVSLDMMAATTAHILEADALRLERVTFEEFAGYSPSQRHNEHGIADKLEPTTKRKRARPTTPAA